MKYFETVSKLICMQDMNSCCIYSDIAPRIVSADFIPSCHFNTNTFCSLTNRIPVILGCSVYITIISFAPSPLLPTALACIFKSQGLN